MSRCCWLRRQCHSGELSCHLHAALSVSPSTQPTRSSWRGQPGITPCLWRGECPSMCPWSPWLWPHHRKLCKEVKCQGRRDQTWECSSSFKKKKKKEIKDNFSRIRKNKHYVTAYIHNTTTTKKPLKQTKKQKNTRNFLFNSFSLHFKALLS